MALQEIKQEPCQLRAARIYREKSRTGEKKQPADRTTGTLRIVQCIAHYLCNALKCEIFHHLRRGLPDKSSSASGSKTLPCLVPARGCPGGADRRGLGQRALDLGVGAEQYHAQRLEGLSIEVCLRGRNANASPICTTTAPAAVQGQARQLWGVCLSNDQSIASIPCAFKVGRVPAASNRHWRRITLLLNRQFGSLAGLDGHRALFGAVVRLFRDDRVVPRRQRRLIFLVIGVAKRFAVAVDVLL